MKENTSNESVRVFPRQVFATCGPAQLKQGAWQFEADFCAALEQSWCSQFADYIGERDARLHINQLRQEGRLFHHHDPLTIQAWMKGRIVGVTSLRPLQGIDLITMLEVHPQFRGLGIGAQLIHAVCSASECLMAHVSIHQPRVQDFYMRQGFALLDSAMVRHGEHDLEFDVVAKRRKLPQ